MTTQPLERLVIATVFNRGVVGSGLSSFFDAPLPSVPQGLTWTGSIMITPMTSGAVAGTNLPGMNQITWTLVRNGRPIVAWRGLGMVADVQANPQDVLTIIGQSDNNVLLPLGTQIQILWLGYSAAFGNAAIVWPRVYGSLDGAVSVYNTQGVDSPLEVVVDPLPANVLVGQVASQVAGNTVTLVPAPAGGGQVQVWELTLGFSVCQLAAVAGATSQGVQIQTTDATPEVLLELTVLAQPSGTMADTATISLHGYQLNPDIGLTMVMTASGASAVRGTSTAVYTTIAA